MSMNVNKPRSTGVVAAAPVARVRLIQFNYDAVDAVPAVPASEGVEAVPVVVAVQASMTVVVDFFESQAAIDNKDTAPFESFSYQVDEPAGIEALVNLELKKLTDFDAVI